VISLERTKSTLLKDTLERRRLKELNKMADILHHRNIIYRLKVDLERSIFESGKIRAELKSRGENN
jgi:hypothetical protein